MKNDQSSHADRRGSYSPPSLRIYGGVLELTAAGTRGGKESGPNILDPTHKV